MKISSLLIMIMENPGEVENSEHQRESSLRRKGKREMEYEAEDEPGSLSRKRRWEPEERLRLKMKSYRKRVEMEKERAKRMKADSDKFRAEILEFRRKDEDYKILAELESELLGQNSVLDNQLKNCVLDNQLKVSEKYEAGNKAHGGSSWERTGKLKKVLEFIKHEELNNEESSHLVKILQDRKYRAYKKAEKEEYKVLAEQINESLKETHEIVENLRAENKTLQNEWKEMACKMEEMVSLKMLKDDVESKRLKEETMHVVLLNQLESYVQEYGKPREHNFDGLPNVGGGLLPTSQVRELGANEPPKAILDVEASTSTTGQSNEENVRLQQQVYELKKDVEALKNLMSGKSGSSNGTLNSHIPAQQLI